MTEEQFEPGSEVTGVREVRIDIPGIGPQRATAEIIDGMAVVEGDIVLGPEEEYTDIEAEDAPEGIVESVALVDESGFWPDGVVPYEIDSDLPREDRVVDAIGHWEENTPIRFVRRGDEDDYVRFFEGSGCWSRVGRQGGRQSISLSSGCGTGSAIHEIAHALGFWHLQSRSDRDVYLTINWENIQDGKEHNFRKHEDANDIGRYDYAGIMHYGSYAFSKNGEKTIEAPEPIGQRRGLSDGEIDAIYRIYGASDAGRAENVTDDWHGISFDTDVAPDPVVLTGIQTYNGPDTVGVRMRDIDAGSAEVFLEEEQSEDDETRHVGEELGFFAVDEGLLYDEDASVIGRSSEFSRDQSDGSEWHPQMFEWHRSVDFADPVVFMQLQSYNGSHPAHLRIRDVDSWWDQWFRFQIEEWGYLDKRHTTEDIGLVVLEEGTHRLRNGIELEVGTVEADHEWQTVSIDAPTDPVVISQCQTYNGHHEVVTRHRDIDRRSFDVRLQEEEGHDGWHTTETIGYVSISEPQAFEFGVAQDDVSHEWSPLDFESDFKSMPVAVASISSYNGPDTAAVRMRNPDEREVELHIEEEQSADTETDHVGERVTYVATPEGPIAPEGSGKIGEAGSVTRNQPSWSDWHTIDLEGEYRSGDPVVFAQVMSRNGNHPVHVRLRDVDSDSFDFQLEEWDYLDQWHTDETIGYVVLETGVHQLPDDRLLEVGTTRTNHTWTSVPLDSRLHSGAAVDATVLSRCQTQNGWQAVVTRHRNVSPTGFDVRLQEEEDNDGWHATETVGYLAAVHDV